MDHVLNVLLNGSVERLGVFSRDAFRVGLALAGNGLARDGVCACTLEPSGGAASDVCRSFSGSLSAASAPRLRCPRGLSVIAREVALPAHPGLLLASHGFLEDGDRPDAGTPEVPRLGPGEIALLERFVSMGALMLASLGPAAGTDDAGHVREEAWRDLLGSPAVIGPSPAAQLLRESLPAAANGADPVFLAGEPGSGRRLLAAAIHRLGPRAARPFVAERLAAIPESLQEAELFGAGGGAGLFDEAACGTVFFADVERLTPRCQQLLRALLEDGAAEQAPRVLAAADADLDEAVRGGSFDARLAGLLRSRVLTVAPLRERQQDIPPIALHLLRRRAAASGVPAPELPEETCEILKSRLWPGNVRELDEELARAAAGRSVIRPEDLFPRRAASARAPAASAGTTLRQAVSELEVGLIEQALAESNWNKSRAARNLGLSRLGLQKKIDRYGIDRRR